jgi:hypothetical protein
MQPPELDWSFKVVSLERTVAESCMNAYLLVSPSPIMSFIQEQLLTTVIITELKLPSRNILPKNYKNSELGTMPGSDSGNIAFVDG